MFTITDPVSFTAADFRTAPFDTVSTPFFFCEAEVIHGEGRIFRAGGITVFVVTDLFEGAFIAWVIRNKGLGKRKVMEQGAVKIRRVERGVAEENIGMEVRMEGEVIRKDRDKGGSIADRFILVRGIGFLLDIQFGMGGFESIIVKKELWRTMLRPLVRRANLSA
jgi:hypothetical protein